MVNELLAEAEQLLDEDRYNTKRARLLAQQATEEAGHSIFIAESVWMVRDKQLTLEEFVLKWEERLQRVAESAGVTLEMDRSIDDVAAKLASRVAQLNRSEQSLREDFADARQYIAAQEEEIRDLDQKIRGASAERETLVLELEAQARTREQILQLQNMFEDHEALIMRESNVVILRLVGLQVESGSADIDTGNQQLLDKIERAIDIYPRCEVVVEGHTDSSGDDALNMRLSQERAESVMTFLTVNGHIPRYRISAVGYGATRPIANNKTKAGRDRNRRIDLLIIPDERAAAY